MRESAVSEKVNQKLIEFENIGTIQPSAGWNESLMNRLASAGPGSGSNFPSIGVLIPLLFIVLINIGVILNSAIKYYQQPSVKDNELMLISDELLINPVSIIY